MERYITEHQTGNLNKINVMYILQGCLQGVITGSGRITPLDLIFQIGQMHITEIKTTNIFFPRARNLKRSIDPKNVPEGGGRSSQKRGRVWKTLASNLSTATIFVAEKMVLNHGLKFAPSRPLNKFQTFIDLHKYIPKINIKRNMITNPFRSNKMASTDIRNTSLPSASLFDPPMKLAPSISIFSDQRPGTATK